MANKQTQINASHGYTEMYEWSDIPEGINLYGRVVQFDPEYPTMIKPAYDNRNIVGVSTVNYVNTSDDPENWHGENKQNEVGDTFLTREVLAIGEKKYDNVNEMSYIQTRKWDHLIPIKSSSFDSEKKYVKRSNRKEWTRVCLLGKAYIRDNGECVPGGYGTLYKGREVAKIGTLVPSLSESDSPRYYIINRVTNNSVFAFVKPQS